MTKIQDMTTAELRYEIVQSDHRTQLFLDAVVPLEHYTLYRDAVQLPQLRRLIAAEDSYLASLRVQLSGNLATDKGATRT